MCAKHGDEVVCFKDCVVKLCVFNVQCTFSTQFECNLESCIYLNFVHLATVFLGLNSHCSI